jgi:hypothetical protein
MNAAQTHNNTMVDTSAAHTRVGTVNSGAPTGTGVSNCPQRAQNRALARLSVVQCGQATFSGVACGCHARGVALNGARQ